jgi:sulfatase maturation enzyme AslB (radical SAM superfamily)
MRITEPFKIDKFQHDRKIIIYGAGTCGEIALRGLECYGIKPDFFCDRVEKNSKAFGIAIIKPEELPSYKDAMILLASVNYFYEMIDTCNRLNCGNYYDMEEIMNIRIPDERLSFQAQDVFANKARYIDVIHHGQEKDRLCIGKLEINVSEACTLKCKDCSYLMQYYQHPQNVNIQYLKNVLDRLLSVVDRVSEFRLLGGEPFLNQELYKLIDAYYNHAKVGIIDIHTNGTIIPTQRVLDSLKHDNVIVHISDIFHSLYQSMQVYCILVYA